MKDDDLKLFRDEVADVTPVATWDRVRLQNRRTPDAGLAYRREAAQGRISDDNPLPTSYVDYVSPNAVISYRRDGIQHGVFRRLARGEYPIEAVLDLHQHTAEQARDAVYQFFLDCRRHDIRLALINHGKGGRDPGKPPVIKSLMYRWLPMVPDVLAFHSAQNFHGGTGAVYVMLRKTEKMKNKTREALGLIEVQKAPDR